VWQIQDMPYCGVAAFKQGNSNSSGVNRNSCNAFKKLLSAFIGIPFTYRSVIIIKTHT